MTALHQLNSSGSQNDRGLELVHPQQIPVLRLTGEHVFRLQVYYEDTDFSGVVYHANYLRFLDRAREHFLGVKQIRDLYEKTGHGFVVYQLRIKYCQSARFGDELQVVTQESKRTAYRSFLDQKIIRPSDGITIVKAKVEIALVDKNHRAVPIG
jgi:tol-pal system-associated acyl-CoA thioesterase